MQWFKNYPKKAKKAQKRQPIRREETAIVRERSGVGPRPITPKSSVGLSEIRVDENSQHASFGARIQPSSSCPVKFKKIKAPIFL